MMDTKHDAGEREERTPEENVAAGFPLAEEIGAFILPDGRVQSAITGKWERPVGCPAGLTDGQEHEGLPH